MGRLRLRFLTQASQDLRFSAQDTEYHIIRTTEDSDTTHEQLITRVQDENYGIPHAFTAEMGHAADSGQSRLRLMLQRTRPPHISGKADMLPFRDAKSLREAFGELDLPASYLQIADGSLATAQAKTCHDSFGELKSFEMVVYCVAKQGDWSIALSHQASTMDTAIFCSLDKKIDAQVLVDELAALKNHSYHPMLVPCIMFDALMKLGIQRRNSIKVKLEKLEQTMAHLSRTASSSPKEKGPSQTEEEDSEEWIQLFELLNSCRKDQASREGRYDFWRSYHAAMQIGFSYVKELLAETPEEAYRNAHVELEQWAALTWQKLNSLIARDKDQINRVENVSTLLYNFVQQRDIRLQSSIARATRRDSEDMKFISLLGSIFLPASLIATVLNVPEFQFLPGAQLFAAYIGITLPLIAVVVVLCMTRSQWSRWKWPMRRRLRPAGYQEP